MGRKEDSLSRLLVREAQMARLFRWVTLTPDCRVDLQVPALVRWGDRDGMGWGLPSGSWWTKLQETGLSL